MINMEKNSNKSFYDFFSKTKTTEINDSSSTVLKMWAMTLFTIYKIGQLFSSFNLKKSLVGIFITSFIIFGLYTFSSIIFAKKEQEALTKQQKISLIKAIDGQKLISIFEHIDKVKEKELTLITKNYWAAKFINDNITSIDMNRVTQRTIEAANKTKQFYDNRKKEISITYHLIEKNLPDLITPTFDRENPIEQILYWNSLITINQFEIREEIEKSAYSWMKYLDDPVRLDGYLKKNEALIKSTAIF